MPEQKLTDELPSPPADAASQPELSGSFDPSLLDDVPEARQPIPKGTYHFRLDQYFTNFNPVTDKNGATIWPEEQPTLGCMWVCQEEPLTGRSFIKNVNWVTPDVFEKAAKGDAAARELLRIRLPEAKSMMKGCEFKLTAGADFFKDFLDQNPECRIQISLKAKKVRQGDQFVDSGEMKNDVVKYIPLSVPFSR